MPPVHTRLGNPFNTGFANTNRFQVANHFQPQQNFQVKRVIQQDKAPESEPEQQENPKHIVDEPQVGEMSSDENSVQDVKNVENAGDSILDYSDDLGLQGGANAMSLDATG